MAKIEEEEVDEILFAEEHGLEPGLLYHYNTGYKEYHDEIYNLHRWTGPARLRNGEGDWFIHGRQLECTTQEEFIEIRDRLIKLKVFW